MASRIGYIDVAKAVAIFLVIYGHVLIKFQANLPFMYEVKDFIYSFHMPLFVFISGLVMRSSYLDKSAIIGDLYKRVRQFIVPFMAFGFIYMLMNNLTVRDLFLSDGKCGLWYLPFIFNIYLLNYVFSWIEEKLPKSIWVDIILYLFFWICLKLANHFVSSDMRNLFSLYYLQLYYPFVAIACFIKKHDLYDYVFGSNLIVYGSIALLLLYPVMKQLGISLWLYYAHPLVAVVSLIGVLYKLKDNTGKANNALRFVGANTLQLYILHYFFISTFSVQCGDGTGVLTAFFYTFLLATCILSLSLLLNHCIKLVPNLEKLLFFK